LFKKIFIANRGEIACRVIRACREMGIRSVAACSDADARALHTRMADEAAHVGASAPRESYLNSERVIAAALQTGCQAIHPGYGFLSENASFAQAVAEAGLVFIGPPASAIRKMGSKTAARELMQNAGVPVVPGVNLDDGSWMTDGATISSIVHRLSSTGISFPVLIKAAAGGGGRGMRVAHNADELAEAIASAKREAQAAFGDDRVYVEQYILNPRHIEIQILADAHGDVLHLFERECSIQRRHQKVIEESPSPFLTPDLRQKMTAAAVAAARAAGYVNAGTVEFIVAPGGAFYFLEMNTRLQVEHPVTEMVTGVDLVQAQIRIAAGERLSQMSAFAHSICQNGHAIECRITAEDAANGFLPALGRITRMSEPAPAPGTRVDTGYAVGDEVTMFYDSLLAKLIVHAPTRPQAIGQMRRALGEYRIEGMTTNLDFLRDVLAHDAFAKGQTTTGFIAEHFANWQPGALADEAASAPGAEAISQNPWRQKNRFRLGVADGSWAVAAPRQPARPANSRAAQVAHHTTGPVAAPMPGLVRQVNASAGDAVTRGQTLAVMEAMKMEVRITAPGDGMVKAVLCAAGAVVEKGRVLFEIE
jgi:acetyl-CoA carboxylase biotin carboxylase subunit